NVDGTSVTLTISTITCRPSIAIERYSLNDLFIVNTYMKTGHIVVTNHICHFITCRSCVGSIVNSNGSWNDCVSCFDIVFASWYKVIYYSITHYFTSSSGLNPLN